MRLWCCLCLVLLVLSGCGASSTPGPAVLEKSTSECGQPELAPPATRLAMRGSPERADETLPTALAASRAALAPLRSGSGESGGGESSGRESSGRESGGGESGSGESGSVAPPLFADGEAAADHRRDAGCEVATSLPMALDRDDPATPRRVALTFDDGPYADRTPPVLDALAQRQQVATFFVLGRHITRTTYAIIQRMAAEGHVIGSHSYDHDIAMATRFSGEEAVRYIRAQHEVTRMLVELALLATSADDFESLHVAVLASPSSHRLTTDELRHGLPRFVERHRAVLATRSEGRRLGDVRYARPPGGGPFLGRNALPRARYEAALRELGMVNVMWHRQSGDVDAKRARDRGFLVHNLVRAGAHGGVVLIHDFIRPDALREALDRMHDDGVTAVALDELLHEKYPCVGEPAVEG